MKLSGLTECGKKWRVICTNRKHPDCKPIVLLIADEGKEIIVCVSHLGERIKSQWFDSEIILDLNANPS